MNAKKRFALALGGSVAMTAEWALLRSPLFGLHGMYDWPWILFIFGLIVVVIAGVLGAKYAVFGTLAGYLVGFFCGIIFNFPGPHPGATVGWLVWTCVFLVGIALGIAVSVIFILRKK